MKARRLVELTIAAFYAIGAATQALDVLAHSDDFYLEMASQSWLPPAKALIEGLLVPNSALVTIMVAVLEATLAVAIFVGRGLVRPALIIGGLFSIGGALTGSPIETLGYGLLAVLHFWLAAKRGVAEEEAAQTG